MKNSIFYALILLTLFCTACYEDKGNYAYQDINEVTIKVNSTYGVMKQNEAIDYTITPEIVQTTGDDNFSNLKFEWYVNTSSDQQKGEVLSTDPTLTIHIDPADPNFKTKYYIRFYVTDTSTEAVEMFPITLEVINPYENAWMVLHDIDNHAEVGSIEYLGGEMKVTPNALSRERGEPLKGLSVSLGSRKQDLYYPSYWGGLDVQTQFYVNTTNEEESGLINQADHFLLVASWSKIIFPEDFNGYIPNSVQFVDSNTGSAMISNGKVFQGSGYSYLMFGMYPNEEVKADNANYYITKAFGMPHTAIGYDNIGHRFLHLYIQNNYWSGSSTFDPSTERGNMEYIPAAPENAADPNNIGSDKEFVDFVGGYWYDKTAMANWQRYGVYAYMFSKEIAKSYIYVFHAYPMTSSYDETDNAPVYALYTINTPNGITKDTPMTSGKAYNNILFYAVGNKVYKLDFGVTNGLSTLIYQHPDSEAEISCLQMAYEGYVGYEDEDKKNETYGHPYSRCMAVGVNLPDNKGEVIILQLNNAGKIDEDAKYPAIQTHTGFGKIKDITFI